MIAVQCRLCGRSVDSEDAAREIAGMEAEAALNLARAQAGRGSKYREGAKFVLKILPDMDRNKAWFDGCVAKSRAAERRTNWLDRRNFPAGTAGNLYFQACVFLSGLENLGRVKSTLEITDFDFEGMQVVGVETPESGRSAELSVTAPKKPSMAADSTLLGRLGTSAVAGMTAAFACELGMKAILITRNHEAKKTHDLLDLYRALPADSRERLEADFSGIAEALKDGRCLFDKWRYFEGSVTEKALGSLANAGLTEKLAMTARVIADECELAGLDYALHVQKDFEFDSNRGHMAYAERISLNLEAGESAIAWHQVLTAE